MRAQSLPKQEVGSIPASLRAEPVKPLPRFSAVVSQTVVSRAVVSQAVPLFPVGMETLMALEIKIRATATLKELQILIANGMLNLAPASQVLVFTGSAPARLKMGAASNVARVDPHAPAVAAFEHLVQTHMKAQALATSGIIGPFLVQSADSVQPLHGAILPLIWQGQILGALLCLSHLPWQAEPLNVLARAADTTAHAWAAHAPFRRWKIPGRTPALLVGVGLIGTALLVFVPVPMTALAPARVVTREPFIVAAPVDGVIDDILVKPNQRVSIGTPLIRFVDLQLSARAETTERELAVADARFKRVGLVALSNLDAKRELAIVEAELALKRSERDFAADQLKRSRVVAPKDGVALFGDKRDWIGRPVTTGERILELGDPTRVEVQLELPIEDAIAMTPGQAVSVFLDSAPLAPVAAQVIRINHEPRLIEGKGMAFIIHARITDEQVPPLGVRGTAHIRGDKVALGLFLFRRPISSLRQWIGL